MMFYFSPDIVVVPPADAGFPLLEWLRFGGTVLLSLAALIFTYFQWRLKEDDFRFALFEKRYEIYKACSEFLTDIAEYGRHDRQRIEQFIVTIQQARFLFSSNVRAEISKMIQLAEKMQRFTVQHPSADYDSTNLTDEMMAMMQEHLDTAHEINVGFNRLVEKDLSFGRNLGSSFISRLRLGKK